MTAAGFGDLIAERIRTEHVSISARWLERLRDLLPVDENEVFPTEHLLDHIPSLIQEVASYVQSPTAEAITANTAITSKAQELGELRHVQRASVHQLLAEYRLLGGILTHFVQEELERVGVSPVASEAIEVVRRVNDALWILMQTTVDTFVSQYTATIADHAARLESFNRMISHELRQPLGTLLYAVPLVRADAAAGETGRRDRLLDVLERNAVRLMQLMEQLEGLSRVQTREADAPDTQRTDVATIAWAAARQLREMAEARDVEIEIAEPLPTLVADVARVELILTNLISNAIKYSDPRKPRRVVKVESVAGDDPKVPCVAVRDNGLGIPDDQLPTIFHRFVRAHASLDEELGNKGSGLGLAIVAECVEAIGGSIRAESTFGEGTSFFVTLPQQREA